MNRKTDADRFADLIGALCEAFRREATHALVEAYWLALDDLPIDAVEKGVRNALRESNFMPAPVEIRERASTAGAAQAEIAWDCLVKAIRNARGEPVWFEDGIAASIVERLGGWERLTSLPTEELHKWTRDKFVAMYRSSVHHGDSTEPRSVAGWLENGSPKGCATRQHVMAGYIDRVKKAVEDFSRSRRGEDREEEANP